MSRSHDDYISS